MVFSEDSRVKIPCILHLVRLGYSYLSLKGASWDEQTNIFPALFCSSLARINPGVEADASIGGMVICDSADQARQMFEIQAVQER